MCVRIIGGIAEKRTDAKSKTAGQRTDAENTTGSTMKAVSPTEDIGMTAESASRHAGTKNAGRKTVLATIDLPLLVIERHESEVPWLKIFVRRSVREFSDCTPEEKQAIWYALDVIEREMLRYYHPEKINIASFGNMLPQVHWHIMARFKEDSYFPEPMWGTRQCDARLVLPPFEPFLAAVAEKLGASV